MTTKFEIGKKYLSISKNIYTCIAINSKGIAVLDSDKYSTIINEERFVWTEYKEPKRGTVWVNVFDYGYSAHPTGYGCYMTKEKAKEHSGGPYYLATIEVPWVEGQGV